jgi:hypothetical protein
MAPSSNSSLQQTIHELTDAPLPLAMHKLSILRLWPAHHPVPQVNCSRRIGIVPIMVPSHVYVIRTTSVEHKHTHLNALTMEVGTRSQRVVKGRMRHTCLA